MTTKSIEAGARAIYDKCGIYPNYTLRQVNDLLAADLAKACIEAAIASGELVPASAVAAERERCIQAIQNAPCPDEAGYYTMTKDEAIDIIRDLEPASGEYVLVPREPTEAMIRAGDDAFDKSEEDQEYQTK